MQILPVIDLRGGVVVRGASGRRARYRPVTNLFARDARPASVAAAFARHFSFDQAYVADLDAIEGSEPAWDLYRAIADAGLRLWLDAGIRDPRQAAALVRYLEEQDVLQGLVVGLETVDGLASLAALCRTIGPERLLFSLDLYRGATWRARSNWHRQRPLELADDALRVGVERLLILDLERVGRRRGIGTESICRQVRERAPQAWIAAGGGIRGAADARAMTAFGCNALLVASALHDGSLTAEDCPSLRRPCSDGSGHPAAGPSGGCRNR